MAVSVSHGTAVLFNRSGREGRAAPRPRRVTRARHDVQGEKVVDGRYEFGGQPAEWLPLVTQDVAHLMMDQGEVGGGTGDALEPGGGRLAVAEPHAALLDHDAVDGGAPFGRG